MLPPLSPGFPVWHTRHEGFGFACTHLTVTPAGVPIRCGKKTYILEHIGGNDMQLAVCEDHMHPAQPGGDDGIKIVPGPLMFQEVTECPEPIVSMITFNGDVLVATTNRVYKLINEKLVPLRFEMAPESTP